MNHLNILDIGLLDRFKPEIAHKWRFPCRPRILVVTDSSLNFNPNSGFGLWRFLHAITVASGVTNKPVLALAHRGAHTPTVTIESDTYTVDVNFNFATANPTVTTGNYDQLWLFGFGGAALSNAEIGVISEFMNSGGGVFATGDHATIGQQMCGALPRVRHMREWSSIPMGTENDVNVAVMRIDTVVNPGFVEVQWAKPTGAALEKVVERLKALKLTLRNVPMDAAAADGICVFTGEPAVERVLVGRSY